MKKYELTKETNTLVDGTVLHRIRALRDIPRYGVNAGDLGGLIEKYDNLSQDGDAWVSGDAKVSDNACVRGDALVFGNAWVYGDAEVNDNARVSGNALVFGNACVRGDADYMVIKNTWSSGMWFTYTRSNKKWVVGCFYGTGEELIKKAYKDSELSGRCYEAIVRAVETIEAAKAEAKGETNGRK